jgi:hypothetical protein
MAKKLKIKVDQSKEARRASRAILPSKGGKAGPMRERRRIIEEEEADKEMEEGLDLEHDCE